MSGKAVEVQPNGTARKYEKKWWVYIFFFKIIDVLICY